MTDIKSEIGPLTVKPEPKWEMEVEVLGSNDYMPPGPTDLNDIVIANTIIRKVEPQFGDDDNKDNFFDDTADVSWKTVKANKNNEDSNVSDKIDYI